jgi:taurine dioxygenase
LSQISITPISNALGADVSGIDLRQPIAADDLKVLTKAWADHLVLRFRGQRLTDPELLAFSRNLGELDKPGPNPYGKPFLGEFPEINVISNVKENGVPIGNLGDGEAIWHCDMSYIDTPPRGAMLHALELPEAGGDTEWANMYLAYEGLPEYLRKAIAGRRAIHDSTYNSAGMMRKGMKEVTDPREAPGARHPLVIQHPITGRAALYLGRRRNSYIVGLPLDESESLLDELWAQATRPEITFRQQWQLYDLMLWDNAATLHRRDSFDPHARRVMHRTQIKGGALSPMPGA